MENAFYVLELIGVAAFAISGAAAAIDKHADVFGVIFLGMVAKVTEKKDVINDTVPGSQFRQPYLEFSGSCAGCAETSYARLVTQLFGDHMLISNATGCSSIWGGPAATSPYTVNKEGKGPAWPRPSSVCGRRSS